MNFKKSRYILDEWCRLRKTNFSYKVIGPDEFKNFTCELTMPGIKYVAFGEGVGKKDCETSAAAKMIEYLINIGEMKLPQGHIVTEAPESHPIPIIKEIPSTSKDSSTSKKEDKYILYREDEDFKADPSLHGNWTLENCRFKLHEYCRLKNLPLEYKISCSGKEGDRRRNIICELDLYVKSVNKSLHVRKCSVDSFVASRLCSLSLARQLYHLGEMGPFSALDRNKKSFDEDDEDFKADPKFKGNWNIDNCKFKLQEYCHLRKLPLKYKFTMIDLKHSGSNYDCKVDLHVESKILHAHKYASNKLMASKLCALSIVRQLYHLGKIGDFGTPDPLSGTKEKIKKKKKVYKPKAFEMSVDKDLIEDVDKYLEAYGIQPVKVPKNIKKEESLCLVLKNNDEENGQNKKHSIGGVFWLPPQPGWNPWTRSNITEGSFADLSLPDISELLKLEYDYRVENDADVQKMLDNQKKFAVYPFKEDILYASYQSSVIIIKGPPDCGKTTQVPQYILNAYLQANCGAKCGIVVTQPLCLHAISAAEIVAREWAESPGNTVGFDVKFESCLPRPYGSILYCNVGVFLKKLEIGMRGISHVIIDNIQEKDIFTDFTMALLRDMVHANPQLRVILMCSSSDVTLYYEYFGRCPIIEIAEPNFPVKEYFLEDCIELINYIPCPKGESEMLQDEMKQVNCSNDDAAKNEEDLNKVIDAKYSEATRETMALISEKEINFDFIIAMIKYILGLEDNGTILIVGNTWLLLIKFIKLLKEQPDLNHSDYCILILHDCITKENMHKILEPVQDNIRKIIVATQVAETSVLVSDVVYVIDWNRTMRLNGNVTNRILSNYTSWCSKENHQMRKSRASSVRPGYVFNICSQARFMKSINHNELELSLCDEYPFLYEICLLVKLLHLGDVTEFLSKTLKPPEETAVKLSEDYLRDIGAFDSFNELTSLGKLIAHLPLEPDLGKMIIISCIFKIAEPICFIAAYESSYNFWKDKQWGKGMTEFISYKPSDHLRTLNLLMNWEEKFKEGEKVEEQFCMKYLLVHEAFLNAYNAKNYLKDLLISAGFPESCFELQTFRFSEDDKRLDMILASVCAGLYPNISINVGHVRSLTNDEMMCSFVPGSIMRLRHNIKCYPSPYLVYSKRISAGIVYLKEISVITPLTLLLFGCKRAEYINGNIFVDKWIQFQSSPHDIAKILALHFPIQELVSQVTGNPKILTCLGSKHTHLLELIKSICGTDAYSIKWCWEDHSLAAAQKTKEIEGPPAKIRKLNDGDSRDTQNTRSISQIKIYGSKEDNLNAQRKVYGNQGINICKNSDSSRLDDRKLSHLGGKESFCSSKKSTRNLDGEVSGVSNLDGESISQRKRSEHGEYNYNPQRKVYWNQDIHANRNISQLDNISRAKSCSNYEYFSNDRRKQKNVDSRSSMHGSIQKGNHCRLIRQADNTQSQRNFGFNKVSSFSKKYQKL